MRLTYDPKAKVACIRLREKAGDVETIGISDDLLIDISSDDLVFWIELLNANERLTQDDGKFVFVDPRSGGEKTLKVA